MTSTPVGRASGEPRWARLGRGAIPRLPRVVLLPSQQRSRVPFALVVLLLLGSGLIGLLLLNTVLAQDAFVLHQLRQQTAVLSDTEQQLRQEVARAEAPAVLASRAAGLGMVPGGDPLFLRLPDGAVLGDPAAAGGVAVPPTAQASIAPTATPTATLKPTSAPTPMSTPMPTAKATAQRTRRLASTQPTAGRP